jgi:ubiquinol-cytochrome c reductase cytochrome b subunit
MHILLIPLALLGLLSAHLALVWHQTHTQFEAPGRTEQTVTGTPVWPKFAVKAIGLALVTFAVLTALGGLAQINPVWFYGPFVPYSAPSPAQPDFYVGWLEGLLRLSPNWELHLFGITIPNLFMPAVVIPGVIFTVLALWPFLEARATHDTAWHHFAQKPRQAPVRSAIGAGGLTFFIVLTLAGSNDVLAKFLDVEVDTLNVYLKAAVFVLPIVVAIATYRICRDLGARDPHPMTHPERVVVRRNAEGGFDTEHGEPAGTETRG